MNITLDHNVVIDFVNGTSRVGNLRAQIAAGAYEPFVVEIGASEMRERGIQPDRYDLFEALLREAGLESAPRLPPLGMYDVTFYGHCLYSSKELHAEVDRIEQVLFGDSPPAGPGSRAWLNRTCDVLSMWCHIRAANDIFVTSDGNFHKASKLPRLVQLGARRIERPDAL